jgi:VWFA-related protein
MPATKMPPTMPTAQKTKAQRALPANGAQAAKPLPPPMPRRRFSSVAIAARARAIGITLAFLAVAGPALSQRAPYVFHGETRLVLVNVQALDRNGHFVRDLKAGDFTLLEDGKPQRIVSFDVENIETAPEAPQAPGSVPLSLLAAKNSTPATNAAAVRDRRLVVLFFDLSSMQPEDVDRAVAASVTYVQRRMTAADIASVVVFSDDFHIVQDFTSDRAALLRAVRSLNSSSGQGFENGGTGTTESTPDTSQPFAVDDTEFNIFNTDRRLQALRTVADALSQLGERKSLIYFSSGATRTGIENEAELRAAVNAAVRANLAIYTVDVRGLQAVVPGGEAQNASLRGTGAYSGAAMLSSYDSQFASQETLTTLADDTGGRAFLSSNDLTPVFAAVQRDTAFYYVLGYHSTNPAADGRYRHIEVKIRRPGMKLVYRRGYYADTDFRHTSGEDRERELFAELNSAISSTDLPVFLSTGYFRVAKNRFYVPVSIAVPGWEIPFSASSNRDKATLDVLGVARDSASRLPIPVAMLRDTVKLAVGSDQRVRQKNVQYNGAFILGPGRYHLKFVVRENQTGRTGSFETDIEIPDFKSTPLRMSSILLASQSVPEGGAGSLHGNARRNDKDDPLVVAHRLLVPSVTRVFAANQHVTVYFDVYDPRRASPPGAAGAATGANAAAPGPGAATRRQPRVSSAPAPRVLASAAVYRDNIKVFETPLQTARAINSPQRDAATFALDLPLSALQPGLYICQVNAVDDVSGRFAFPRLAFLVRPAANQPPIAPAPIVGARTAALPHR